MANILGLIESAVGGNSEDMRTLLTTFYDQHNVANQANGTNWLNPTNQVQEPYSAPPPAATATVTGANGSYHVQVTNPAQSVNATIYHEISYSNIKSFGQNVTTQPVTAATAQTIPAPGQSNFFRLRSSYDRQNWNAYALISTTAIAAGLQTSAASENNSPLNQSNYGYVDSVAAGSSANVRVFGAAGPGKSFVSVKGAAETVMPSATIVNVPYGSTQIVSYDGEQYQVKPTLPGVFPDSWTPVGQVSVVGSGTPTLPTITPVLSGGHLVGLSYTPGSGMTQAPILTVADTGGGTGATVTATISAGQMTGYSIGNAGSGYSGATTVTASGGVFAGASGGGTASGGNGGRLTKI